MKRLFMVGALLLSAPAYAIDLDNIKCSEWIEVFSHYDPDAHDVYPLNLLYAASDLWDQNSDQPLRMAYLQGISWTCGDHPNAVVGEVIRFAAGYVKRHPDW